jgi:hypothetical protein
MSISQLIFSNVKVKQTYLLASFTTKLLNLPLKSGSVVILSSNIIISMLLVHVNVSVKAKIFVNGMIRWYQ